MSSNRKFLSKRFFEQARKTDPSFYLEQKNLTVKWNGRHAEVFEPNGKKAYRITLKDDNCYVCCHYDESRVGYGSSSIDLVMNIEECNEVTAVQILLKNINVYSTTVPKSRKVISRRPPNLPPSANRMSGRNYLLERGISLEVIDEAERQGFIHFVEGAVLCLGYDIEGEVQLATRRGYKIDDLEPKKELYGSLKNFSPILRGDADEIWIVEGMVDALAAQTWSERHNRRKPTVLVSGGAQINCFLRTPHIQDLLKSTKKIIIFDENESNPVVQAKTDQGHAKLREKILALVDSKVTEVLKKRAPGAKDLAEYNLKELNKSFI
jgi:hypothetical protein